MINGLGVDIVSLKDFDQIIKQSEAFLQKHFTVDELQYSERASAGMLSHLAVRYAAKEAVIKALESTHLFRPPLLTSVDYREIEVAKDPQGRPYLIFYGEIKKIIEDLKFNSLVSLSHDGDYALAQVILVQTE